LANPQSSIDQKLPIGLKFKLGVNDLEMIFVQIRNQKWQP
jgi:hypothetical protein